MTENKIPPHVKIVADSSADIHSLDGISFACAPLKIITAQQEYTDDELLDSTKMVEDLLHYKGKSSTSCPNPEDWLRAFGTATQIYCVTITGTLSGSYNSACMAKKLYQENHPEAEVLVINSLSAGPELKLIMEKLQELIAAGLDFSSVTREITAYQRNTGLLFMLESMKNLANNGRVSAFSAKAAGLLGIRVVGKASDRGDLEPLEKCRGENNALSAILRHMKSLGFVGGKVRIAHCLNENAAKKLRDLIKAEFARARVQLYPCGGLCSFYAEKGGLLVGFEKNIATAGSGN